MKLDRIQRKVLLIYAVVIGLGVAYTLIIFTFGRGIPCYFRELTGFLCPGCGTSRMMLSLIRLDIRTAFSYNPVAFISLMMWVSISVMAFIGRPKFARNSKALMGVLYAMIVAYCLQGVLRNII